MSQIIYENEDAVFTFSYRDMLTKLIQTMDRDHFQDMFMLCKWLQDNSDEGQQDIRIESKNVYRHEECLYRIVYVIKDLFCDHKGSIYCKKCNQVIPISQIGKTPLLGANDGITARLNQNSRINEHMRTPPIGRTKYFCSKKHELFGIIDWQ